MLFRKRITYHQLSDEELVSLYRDKSSSDIVGEIYKRYGHLVMGTCMKYLKNQADAEDMTMNIFEKLPNKLKNHSIERFKSWLYMVTKNECLMLLRKKGHASTEITKELEAKDELHLAEAKEIKYEMLEEAIQELKEEQRKCIELFYIESKSYQEITTLLKLDIKKVKSAIQNGKRNLKLTLEKRNEFKSAI
ncbi:MAG: sigma-70 family RNA polymerase sigma factor [Flavobacteriales bacterium]|nr:sigma-70 family RNA polymerase sigma factor [Flavobacteriales bacterium]